MCFEVTNTTDKAMSVIYSQWVTTEIVPEAGAMQELVLPSGVSAVTMAEPQTETAQTRHRLKVYAGDTMTIFRASDVEQQEGLTIVPAEAKAESAGEDELPPDGPA